MHRELLVTVTVFLVYETGVPGRRVFPPFQKARKRGCRVTRAKQSKDRVKSPIRSAGVTRLGLFVGGATWTTISKDRVWFFPSERHVNTASHLTSIVSIRFPDSMRESFQHCFQQLTVIDWAPYLKFQYRTPLHNRSATSLKAIDSSETLPSRHEYFRLIHGGGTSLAMPATDPTIRKNRLVCARLPRERRAIRNTTRPFEKREAAAKGHVTGFVAPALIFYESRLSGCHFRLPSLLLM
jgi:hypothetical protein